MRWLRPSLAVLGALFLLTATLAYSDYGVQDKGSYYSGPTGEKTDATGNRAVVDMDRDRNNWRLIPLVNTQVAASGTAMTDSNTTPVATYDLRRMNLLLKGNFDSLSTVVRVAVQIRGHWGTGNDSSLAYPWTRWPARYSDNPSITVASVLAVSGSNGLHLAAAAASLGQFSSIAPGWGVTGTGIAPGTTVLARSASGDSGLIISRNTTAAINHTLTFWASGAPGMAIAQTDSIGHMQVGSVILQQMAAPIVYGTGGTNYYSNDGLWPGEFMVKFNVASQDSSAAGNGKYGADPNTMLIPLTDPQGAWFNAPYTSIRIRTLSGVRSRFKIKADLLGVSQ